MSILKKMHKQQMTVDLICERHCSYYKGNKEGLCCGGLELLLKLIKGKLLSHDMLDKKKGKVSYQFDNLLARLICDRCEFREKDCDYRGSNPNAPPCGGYILLSLLLEKNLLSEKDFLKGGRQGEDLTDR